MNETEEDFKTLQQLIEKSMDQAGEFLKKSFEIPEHSLNARKLVKFLDKGKTVVFVTVNKKGNPRSAPIGSIFYRGFFYLPTVESAVRVKQLKNNPNISLSYYEGNDVAFILHGTAEIISAKHEKFSDLLEFSDINLQSWGKGNEGVFIQIIPNQLFTYFRHPHHYTD